MANFFDRFRSGGDIRQTFREVIPQNYRQDLRNIYSGNIRQKIGGAVGLGAAFVGGGNLPDLGYSEKIAGSPAQVYNNDGSLMAASNEFIGPQSPEQAPAQDPYAGSNVFGGGGGGTPQAVAPNNANIGDRVYDLNDPGQLQQYINDIDTKLNGDFEFYSNRSNQAKELDIAQAKRDEEEAIYNINRALKKLGESKSQYTQDYARSVADLAEGFRQGTARRQSFYASVAPRVYQSSQGTSQEYAQGKYGEGQKRYEENKTRAMNAFAETGSDYERSRKQTQNQFKLFKTQREAQSADEIAEKARQTEELRGQARANTLNYTGALRNAGVSSNKFATPTFQEQDLSGYKPSNVNLNDLMQFIKFQPAGAGMGAAGGATQSRTSQTMATPEAGGQALGSYMGYAPEEEEQSTINAYKKGYGLY